MASGAIHLSGSLACAQVFRKEIIYYRLSSVDISKINVNTDYTTLLHHWEN